MRGITLLLYTLLACSTVIFGDVNVCRDTENEEPFRHEDCNKFYMCKFSRPVEYRCYGDLLFNLETLQCDSRHNVNCEDRYIPPADHVASTDSTALESSAAASTEQKTVSRKKRFLPNGCPDNNIHWLLPHETNCSLFYYCVWGDLVLKECPPGTHFNKALQVCDWPRNAKCLQTNSNPTTPGITTTTVTTLESTTNKSTEETISESSNSETIIQRNNTKIESLPNGCPVNPHIHWLLPHKTDCTMFYYCVWGDLVLRQCPPGTHFNSVLQVCDWPQNANCSAGLTTILTPSTPEPTTPESTNPEPTKPDPTAPETTASGPTSESTTPIPSTTEPTTPESSASESTTSGPTTPTIPTTPKPTKPEFLPNGCPVNPHIHWLLPHETDCTMFYYCVWGDLVLRQCPPSTHFNSVLQVCDWPQNANCSTELTTILIPSTQGPTTPESGTPEPTKPDPTTPEPTPSETTTPESNTSGLITSEPTTPRSTTLDPTTLELTTSESITPEPTKPDQTTLEPTTSGPTTPEPTTTGLITPESTTPGPTTPDPITPEPTTPIPTTPKPTKPEFLPNGCPVNPHIHWLLPHETDCTMFYYCVWGDLVLRQCAPGTHFNSVLQVCDWPQNANCSAGLTTILTPSTPETTTSESANPEPTKPDPTAPEPTTPGPTSGPTTLIPSIPELTTPESTTLGPTTPEQITPEPTIPEPTNPKTTTQEPTTPKPSKPEFLPNGCPVNPHIHWLLPHETDCTMFYYCVWGDLVLRQCAPGTHFNSVLQVCDWPQNANCLATLPTTSIPSTLEPTTPESGTPEPTKPETTTPEPTPTETTTPESTTSGLITSEPTTPRSTTPDPTTPELTTPESITAEPTKPDQTTLEPTTSGPTTPEPTTSGLITPESTTPGPTTPDPTTPESTTLKPTKAEFLPNGCPVSPHIHWLLPHETDCTMFYYCVWGDLVLRQCAPGTHFNRILQVCDWPQDAGCTPTLNKHVIARRALLSL